jgi:AI-2 transport protein TqsA
MSYFRPRQRETRNAGQTQMNRPQPYPMERDSLNSLPRNVERGISYLYMSAAFFIVTAGLRMAQDIVQPLLLSVFIAVTAVPVFAWLVRKQMASWLALLLVILGVVSLLLLVFWIVMTSLADFTARQDHYAAQLRVRAKPFTDVVERLFPERLSAEKQAVDSGKNNTQSELGNNRENLEDDRDRLHVMVPSAHDDLFGEKSSIPEPRSQQSWRQLVLSQFDPGKVISLVAWLFGRLGLMLSDMFLVLLTVVFILMEASEFPEKLRVAFGENQETIARYQKIVANVRSYLMIKTVTSGLTGLLIACWLWLFGVPYAGLWGLIAFLLNYIPNIGSILAAIPALIVAWLDLGMVSSLGCAVGYLAVNLIIGNIVETRLMGRGMGLSSLVVFCSMVFWGWVLGPVGMLLSVPLTMALRVGFECFDDTKWIGTLLGNNESPQKSGFPS